MKLKKIRAEFPKPENYDIDLASRKGRKIDNVQPDEMSRFELADQENLKNKHPHGAEFLTGPNPFYNCHGLTFACRRTQPEMDFELILADDGFVEIPQDIVQIGDIVLYYDSSGTEVEHSGIVVALREGLTGSDLRLPWIWSKWGKGSEVFHSLFSCPYSVLHVKFYRQKKWVQKNV
jgi:hypothetical protein